ARRHRPACSSVPDTAAHATAVAAARTATPASPQLAAKTTLAAQIAACRARPRHADTSNTQTGRKTNRNGALLKGIAFRVEESVDDPARVRRSHMRAIDEIVGAASKALDARQIAE